MQKCLCFLYFLYFFYILIKVQRSRVFKTISRHLGLFRTKENIKWGFWMRGKQLRVEFLWMERNLFWIFGFIDFSLLPKIPQTFLTLLNSKILLEQNSSIRNTTFKTINDFVARKNISQTKYCFPFFFCANFLLGFSGISFLFSSRLKIFILLIYCISAFLWTRKICILKYL